MNKSPKTHKQLVSWKCILWTLQNLQDYQYWRQKFQIVILKWHQMLQDTERPIKCELGHRTSPNLLDDIISSTSRYWPIFKSLRWVGLKTALYKDQTRLQILRKSGLRNLVCILLIICDLATKNISLRNSKTSMRILKRPRKLWIVYHPSYNGHVTGPQS